MPTLAVVALVLAVVVVLVLARNRGFAHKLWDLTGVPARRDPSTGAEVRPAKTLWDWLELLGIPLALALLAFWFTSAQNGREDRTAADADRENTLRTYLAQMSDLMLDRELLRSKQGSDARNVARTATLTAVRRLDGPRRGLVVQFLAEARLLDNEGGAKVVLRLANLTESGLRGTDLGSKNFKETNLTRALLNHAELSNANLSDATLRQADLRDARLRGTRLDGADIRGAKLKGADIHGASLFRVNLRGASLIGADFGEADLNRADLRGADVTGADFRHAHNVDQTGWRGKPAYGP